MEDTIPSVITVGGLQKVLANLLREGIPIRDMETIVETLGDYGTQVKDTDMLTGICAPGSESAPYPIGSPKRGR